MQVIKPNYSVLLFSYIPTLSKETLVTGYHFYIGQLSCGDTCQIWMWFIECNRYFCKIEKFTFGETNERSFNNPHRWPTAVLICLGLKLPSLVKCGCCRCLREDLPDIFLGFMITSSNGNCFRVTGNLCGEFTSPGEFPAQRQMTRCFDVLFDMRLN